MAKQNNEALQKLYNGLRCAQEAYDELRNAEEAAPVDPDALEAIHTFILEGLRRVIAMRDEPGDSIDSYIPTSEAARILGYSHEHITLLCRRGGLPGAKKVGRNWLVPRGVIEGYTPGPKGFAAHPESNPQKKK